MYNYWMIISLIIGSGEFFKEATAGQAREAAAETSVCALQPHSSPCESHCTCITVKPPKRGHFGTVAFVLSSEVVLLSEVAPFLLLNPIQCV